MVSQGSHCDSDGVPGFMQENCPDEEVFSEVLARREVEDFSVLVAPSEMGASKVIPSSSGGIPIVGVTVEDLGTDSENDNRHASDDNRQASDFEVIEQQTVNRAVKAAFADNKNDREELYVRNRHLEMQRFLEANGLSMADFDKDRISRNDKVNIGYMNSAQFVTGRDEFGLPKFSVDAGIGVSETKDPKGKEQVDATSVFGKLPDSNSKEGGEAMNKEEAVDAIRAKSDGKQDATKKVSWSQVLKQAPPVANELKFD